MTTVMEDNAPGHRGFSVGCRIKNNVRTILWPPNSPDMNPEETLWNDMKMDLGRTIPRPTRPEDLASFAIGQWAAITEARMESLLRHMPQRVQALIDAKGGFTEY